MFGSSQREVKPLVLQKISKPKKADPTAEAEAAPSRRNKNGAGVWELALILPSRV
jgi:hypothetical protein